MNLLKRVFIPQQHVGVRLISWATATRWIGWGFVEYLIPIFFFSFVGTYAQSGVLRSTYGIVFMLALPLAGALANHVRAKYLIIIALLIYPLISVSYFLAGALGMVGFIILARALNGINYALDSTGRATYFRRHVPKDKVGTAFGYFQTLTGFWWIAAVLTSLVLIDYFEIHQLFLFIIPSTLIGLAFVLKIPRDELDTKQTTNWKKYLSLRAYTEMLHEVVLWGSRLKKLALITFVAGTAFTITDFFLPIHLYNKGVSFEKIILLMTIYSIPRLFGTPLGTLGDKLGKKAVPFSFAGTALLFLALAFATSYPLQLLIIFFLSLSGLMLDLAVDAETTRITDPRHYGTLTSAFSEVGQLSAIVGPIAVGFLIDVYNIQIALILLSVISLLVLGVSGSKLQINFLKP